MFDLINSRFREPLTLAGISQSVARSPSHLARITRALTGDTVMHWLDKRRMLEARAQLLETNATIEHIAQEVGFRDAGYFSRRFRKVHGMPPRRWRQLNRTNLRGSSR